MSTKRSIQYWVIPPEANAEFVANMEDVLDVYSREYDGSQNMKMLQVPRRSYSQSYRNGCPGSGGNGWRTSATSCLLASSMQITGYRGS